MFIFFCPFFRSALLTTSFKSENRNERCLLHDFQTVRNLYKGLCLEKYVLMMEFQHFLRQSSSLSHLSVNNTAIRLLETKGWSTFRDFLSFFPSFKVLEQRPLWHNCCKHKLYKQSNQLSKLLICTLMHTLFYCIFLLELLSLFLIQLQHHYNLPTNTVV